ncbi:hypothetical protein OIDMADRAFT_24277 [Oidiodendron maius Zn]|uniref:Uncharacterized protein n=1 Tax=Oidiodendron maius (strain Zn) TaxID=913774 RepID=A0A0C3HC85_OIDMZ|nr:hypothetical protein OIDMADRAFT_24277 [Oidiodendron maius Zn]
MTLKGWAGRALLACFSAAGDRCIGPGRRKRHAKTLSCTQHIESMVLLSPVERARGSDESRRVEAEGRTQRECVTWQPDAESFYTAVRTRQEPVGKGIRSAMDVVAQISYKAVFVFYACCSALSFGPGVLQTGAEMMSPHAVRHTTSLSATAAGLSPNATLSCDDDHHPSILAVPSAICILCPRNTNIILVPPVEPVAPYVVSSRALGPRPRLRLSFGQDRNRCNTTPHHLHPQRPTSALSSALPIRMSLAWAFSLAAAVRRRRGPPTPTDGLADSVIHAPQKAPRPSSQPCSPSIPVAHPFDRSPRPFHGLPAQPKVSSGTPASMQEVTSTPPSEAPPGLAHGPILITCESKGKRERGARTGMGRRVE